MYRKLRKKKGREIKSLFFLKCNSNAIVYSLTNFVNTYIKLENMADNRSLRTKISNINVNFQINVK